MQILNWATFKSFVQAKSLSIQWAQDESFYHLYAGDLDAVFTCTLSLTLPGDSSDVADFETNFKPSGNASLKKVQLQDGVGANLTSTSLSGKQALDVNVSTISIPTVMADGANIDAFERLRVSNPQSLFEFNMRLDSSPLEFNESTATGGTSTHSPNNASQLLAVTAASGSSVIRQSRIHIPYHPGKSQLVTLTGNMGAARANCRKRIGVFNDNDGMFFEQNNTTLYVVIRSATSGSPVDTAVAQSSWNLDKLDGTGTSGYTIDVSKQNIFIIDYQWLGSGRIRYGFSIGGRIVYCHQIVNANILSTVYCRTGSLPVRYSITNTGTTAGTTTLQMTCGSIVSEGGFGPVGTLRSANSGITTKTIATSTTPLMALRLGSSYQTAVLQLIDVAIFCSSSDDLLWEIYFNPTITGGSWTALGIAETNFSATSYSGGIKVFSGFLRGAASAPAVITLENAITKAERSFLGANTFTSTSDIVLIACTSFGTSANTSGAITWREIT